MRPFFYLKTIIFGIIVCGIALAAELVADLIQQAYELPVYTSKLEGHFKPYTGIAVTLVNSSKITNRGSAYVELRGHSIKHKKDLCADDPFANEVGYGYCSGCLVAPDLVLTAKHCTDESSSCSGATAIFDFNGKRVPKNNVFECAEQVTLQNRHDSDIAILRLKKPNPGFPRIGVRRSSKIGIGDEIVMAGSPWGMYQSVALGRVSGFTDIKFSVGSPGKSDRNEVIQSGIASFFNNSGSCIFNKDNGVLEGVLSAGAKEIEYDSKAGCYRSVTSSRMSETSSRAYSEIVPTAAFLADLDREIAKSYSRHRTAGDGQETQSSEGVR